MSCENKYQTGNDEYITPEWLKDGFFYGWFDPCPIGSHNGLEINWENRTFINPPYSNPLPWCEKAVLEAKKGKIVVLLLKHDSSTKWYKLLHAAGAHFIMLSGRLCFSGKKAAPFASVLAMLYCTEVVV